MRVVPWGSWPRGPARRVLFYFIFAAQRAAQLVPVSGLTSPEFGVPLNPTNSFAECEVLHAGTLRIIAGGVHGTEALSTTYISRC
jgi:hypothetical protein